MYTNTRSHAEIPAAPYVYFPSVSACRGRAVRACGGAGQARSVCVRAACPAPVTPSPVTHIWSGHMAAVGCTCTTPFEPEYNGFTCPSDPIRSAYCSTGEACVAPRGLVWEHGRFPCGPLAGVAALPRALMEDVSTSQIVHEPIAGTSHAALSLSLASAARAKAVPFPDNVRAAWADWLQPSDDHVRISDGSTGQLKVRVDRAALNWNGIGRAPRMALHLTVKHASWLSAPFTLEVLLPHRRMSQTYTIPGDPVPFATLCLPGFELAVTNAVDPSAPLSLTLRLGRGNTTTPQHRRQLSIFSSWTEARFARPMVIRHRCCGGDVHACGASSPAEGSAMPTPARVLTEAFADVEIVSRAWPSLGRAWQHRLLQLSSDPGAQHTLRPMNPTFYGDKHLLVRYTNAHDCPVEWPQPTPIHRASVLVRTDLSFGGAQIVPEQNLRPANGSCDYNGLEDPRAFSAGSGSSFVAGAVLEHVKIGRNGALRAFRCVSRQVLVSPLQRTIRVLRAPFPRLTAEKNWVVLEGTRLVYVLFDQQLRTHFIDCGPQQNGDINGGDLRCAYGGFVRWTVHRPHQAQTRTPARHQLKLAQELVRVRSSTNWLRIGPKRMLAIAHEAHVTIPASDTSGAVVEYASRFLRWDEGNGTLAVFERTYFGSMEAMGEAPSRKGRVEFSTGLRMDPSRPGHVLIAYGVADCHAQVARAPLEVLNRLRVDFWLRQDGALQSRGTMPSEVDVSSGPAQGGVRGRGRAVPLRAIVSSRWA